MGTDATITQWKSKMIKIGAHSVGQGCSPFIIAEMSGNHNQSLDRAFELVDAAASAGVHALKLQTYTAETITLDLNDSEFVVSDKNILWAGQNLAELYRKAHTPWEWHSPIMERARQHGLVVFSSPFDETAVDFLETLNVPAYKIASFEIVHLPLIKKAASTGKPLIMSTGMASVSEIAEAVSTAREAGCKELVLLKCTSTYPASPENTNLLTITHMRNLFQCEIGISDHTMGVGASVAAVALGATVIEKHFTLSRADGGVDSTFSLEPAELKALVEETHRAHLAIGSISYGPTPAEEKSLIFRRSIYCSNDINEGELFTSKNIKIIRPGLGLKPKHYDSVMNKRAKCNLKKGTPLKWSDIS